MSQSWVPQRKGQSFHSQQHPWRKAEGHGQARAGGLASRPWRLCLSLLRAAWPPGLLQASEAFLSSWQPLVSCKMRHPRPCPYLGAQPLPGSSGSPRGRFRPNPQEPLAAPLSGACPENLMFASLWVKKDPIKFILEAPLSCGKPRGSGNTAPDGDGILRQKRWK